MNYVSLWVDENLKYYELFYVLQSFGKTAKERFGFGVKDALIIGKKSHTEFFMPENEIKRIEKESYKFFMNKKNFDSFVNIVNRTNKNMINAINKIIKLDFSKLSDINLAKLAWSYGSCLSDIGVCYSLTEPIRVTLFEKELVNYLELKKLKDIPHIFTILTGSEVSFVLEKNHDLCHKTIKEAIKESGVKKELIQTKFYRTKKISQKARTVLIKELHLSKSIIHIANVLSKLAEKRMELRFAMMLGSYYYELFTEEVIKRTNTKREDYELYDSNELDNLALNGVKISDKVLRQRKKGFMKILRKGEIKTLTGNKAIQYLSKITKSLRKAKEIQGVIASKGHVVGKAIIFDYRKSKSHSEKMKKMRKGDIVITQMTRPNIIPACEKAGAIITEEGGILCHAAIISRELQVPCIIGIDRATSIFKDGDYIEVCANIGIIRKISKQEYKKKKKEISEPTRIIKKHNAQTLNKLKAGNLFWFNKVGKRDVLTVGGKGANLGELSKFVKVPKGFCVSVNPYSKFLRKNKLKTKIEELLRNMKISNAQDIELRAKKIQKLILSCKLNPALKKEIISYYNKLSSSRVAVRSSATTEDLPSASFAGQQDTYLNIKDANNVVKAVQKCWASLFTPRAIYYREKNKFSHSKVLISVIIQEMVASKYSGVMFTEDPLAKKDILIEVVKGLGEKLVSGEITPNSYLIYRNKFKICKKQVRFKFEEHLIKKLVKIGKKIENHYKIPQDIEWSIDEDKKVYILQSRAITT